MKSFWLCVSRVQDERYNGVAAIKSRSIAFRFVTRNLASLFILGHDTVGRWNGEQWRAQRADDCARTDADIMEDDRVCAFRERTPSIKTSVGRFAAINGTRDSSSNDKRIVIPSSTFQVRPVGVSLLLLDLTDRSGYQVLEENRDFIWRGLSIEQRFDPSSVSFFTLRPIYFFARERVEDWKRKEGYYFE